MPHCVLAGCDFCCWRDALDDGIRCFLDWRRHPSAGSSLFGCRNRPQAVRPGEFPGPQPRCVVLIGDDGVMDGQQSIRTARLCLLETSVALLEACATDNLAQAERLLGVSLCEDWQTDKWLWELRLAEAKKDPAFLPWLPRAIVLADSSQLIGHLNFHSAPGPSYLQQIAPGGLELGYTIFAPYRRNGYAEEAVTGLLKWTAKHRGVRHFVFSIRPDNTPSVRIAHKLGFSKIGQHEDEVDGTEDIYSCHWP